MHIEIEISNVRDFQDIGGIQQPVIGQRRVTHDIRIKEGEASVLGGLMQTQVFTTRSGIPFLGDLPILRYLFSTENKQVNSNEILIVLIPHLVRLSDIDEVNMRGVASGTEQIFDVKINREPNQKPALPPVAGEEAAPAPAEPAEPAAEERPAEPGPPAEEEPAPAGAEAPEPEPAPEEAPMAEEPQPAPEEAAQPRLVFQPAPVTFGAGEQAEVQLLVENVEQLFGSPLRIGFDPQLARLADIQAGPFLKGDGVDLIFSKNIRNEVGQAAVNISRFPGTGGVDGGGVLVTLTLEGVQPGEFSLRVTPTGARNAEGRPVRMETARMDVRVAP